MKLRELFAVMGLTMGITTLQFAIIGASPIMIVCALLQCFVAFRII